jgi:cytochrome c
MASVSKKGGAIPFSARFSAQGTKDFDNDELTYQWEVVSDDGSTRMFTGFAPTVSFGKAGVYKATLTVTDTEGASNQASLRVIAGNEPPVVHLQCSGNQTFFFNDSRVDYKVSVTDKEDGSLAGGQIPATAVAVSVDYISQGFRFTPALMRHAALDSSTRFVVAEVLINNSDCKTCHTRDTKTVGPAFREIAAKYKPSSRVIDTLAKRIIEGSHGVWGTDNNMPAHPSITRNDARAIANYVLSTNTQKPKTLPVQGSFITRVPEDDKAEGTYIFRAAYTDHGVDNLPSHISDSIIFLRSPKLSPLEADISQGAIRDQLDEYVFLTAKPNSFIAYQNIDLTEVRKILFRPNWHLYDIYPGGRVEIHLDSPDGQLIGEAELAREQFNTRYRGAFGGLPKMTKEQQERSRRYPPIDQDKFFARGSDKNSFTIPSVAAIKTTKGRHDVYFLFKNRAHETDESLFPLAEIEMLNR